MPSIQEIIKYFTSKNYFLSKKCGGFSAHIACTLVFFQCPFMITNWTEMLSSFSSLCILRLVSLSLERPATRWSISSVTVAASFPASGAWKSCVSVGFGTAIVAVSCDKFKPVETCKARRDKTFVFVYTDSWRLFRLDFDLDVICVKDCEQGTRVSAL